MHLSRRTFTAALAAQAVLSVVPAYARGRSAGPVDFQPLAARMAGDVLTPASSDYEQSRRLYSFNSRTDRRPAAIARCVNADDVARAIEFARSHQLELAVRSGGHDVQGASTCDDGLVIDLSRMNWVRPSAAGGSITVGPGAYSGDVLKALAPRGEVLPMVNSPDVGMGGLTLGGGIGLIAGSYGATCDSLLRARVVTADGKLLTVSKDENPDVFWALHGGGGNFGVVVELEFTTYQLPRVTAGMLVLDGQHAGDFLHFFPEYMAKVPRELVVEGLVLSPGRRIILLPLCYVGDPRKLDAVIAPLRSFGTVLADGVRSTSFVMAPMPTPEVAAILAGDQKAAAWNTTTAGMIWRGGSIQNVTDGAVEAMLEGMRTCPGNGWSVGLSHHMHGALCDVGPERSPMPRPRNNFTYITSTVWNDLSEGEAHLAWVDATWSSLAPFGVPTYINYLSTDEPAAVAAAYGENFTRLRAIKRRYDPDNVFRRNRNVPPA